MTTSRPRWWLAAGVALLLALGVWAWFARDLRGLENPRVVAQTSAGGTVRSGPSTFRLDAFTIAAALPGPRGQVAAPAGTRFVEVRLTQTLVGAAPDPERYFCEYDLVDGQGRRWDGGADELGDLQAKGESRLCPDAPPEHPVVGTGRGRSSSGSSSPRRRGRAGCGSGRARQERPIRRVSHP